MLSNSERAEVDTLTLNSTAAFSTGRQRRALSPALLLTTQPVPPQSLLSLTFLG